MSTNHAATPACRGSTSFATLNSRTATGGAEGIINDGFDGFAILGGAEL